MTGIGPTPVASGQRRRFANLGRRAAPFPDGCSFALIGTGIRCHDRPSARLGRCAVIACTVVTGASATSKPQRSYPTSSPIRWSGRRRTANPLLRQQSPPDCRPGSPSRTASGTGPRPDPVPQRLSRSTSSGTWSRTGPTPRATRNHTRHRPGGVLRLVHPPVFGAFAPTSNELMRLRAASRAAHTQGGPGSAWALVMVPS